MTGHLLWFANGAIGNAAVAALGADTLGMLVPRLGEPVPRAAVLLSYYAALVAINVRGTRQGANFSQLATVVKLAPLLGLVAFGLPHVHAVNLRIGALPSPGPLGRTSVLLFFAFMGFENALNTSGEVMNPARTVPRALLVALSLIATLYLGIQTVAQGVLGPALAGTGDAPRRATALASFGASGAALILVATVLSTAGVLAGDALGTPRVMQALGRDHILPRVLERIDPKRGTPIVAVVAYGVLCAALALSGTFGALANAEGSSGTLCIYLVCCVGVLRLRSRGVRGDRAPFVVPGGAAVPVLATVTVLFVLAGLERRDLLMLGALPRRRRGGGSCPRETGAHLTPAMPRRRPPRKPCSSPPPPRAPLRGDGRAR